MTFSKQLWKDRIKDAQGNIIQEGTPFSAGNMNRIEQGIEDATVQLADMASEVQSAKGLPSYASTAPGQFDIRLSQYNAKPEQLRAIQTALAKVKAGMGEARIGFLGDSTVAGVGAQAGDSSWPAYFMQMLSLAGYPLNGSGLVPLNKGDLTIDPRMLPSNGAWAGSGWTVSLAGYSSLMQGASSAFPLQFTPTQAGTIVRVGYNDSPGASFSITVDGNAPVNVIPAGGDNGRQVAEITDLPNTAHTVTITPLTGVPAQIFDVEVASTGSGVRWYNAGIGGSQMQDLARNDKFSVSTIVGTKFSPHLVFISSEINGLPGGRTLAQYKQDTNDAITRATITGATPVLLTANPVESLFSAEYKTYTNALYEVAMERNIRLIDIQARWDYGALNGAGLMADSSHPNAAGYHVVARMVWEALGL